MTTLVIRVNMVEESAEKFVDPIKNIARDTKMMATTTYKAFIPTFASRVKIKTESKVMVERVTISLDNSKPFS